VQTPRLLCGGSAVSRGLPTTIREALEELLVRRLEAIEGAEARLSEGTFGRSIQSGEPIPDGRLEIEPWAELTVEEQAGA
jgi:RNA polymerase-binding transcription factor DksA